MACSRQVVSIFLGSLVAVWSLESTPAPECSAAAEASALLQKEQVRKPASLDVKAALVAEKDQAKPASQQKDQAAPKQKDQAKPASQQKDHAKQKDPDAALPMLVKKSQTEPGEAGEAADTQAKESQENTEAKESQDTEAKVDLGTYGLSAIPAFLLDRMVMSNPYKCQFLIAPNEPRAASCDKLTAGAAGVNPAALTAEANGTTERPNALRTLLPLGPLPCCTTLPFCAAPVCKEPMLETEKTCTKRSAASNYAYMVHPEVWPAYHGFGGSFEFDVQKHWDVLSRLHGAHPHLPPFDLMIDLGANSGLVTEKLAMRRFALDYVMVEAQPPLAQLFASRLGNDQWRKDFLREQVTIWPGAVTFDPHFEWKTFALSDKSGGLLDSFSYQINWADWKKEQLNTTAEMMTVDDIFPEKLSPDFQTRFAQAKSAYVKIDVEGMDQKVLTGMQNLLKEKRGDDHLVNFMMMEFCKPCFEKVRATQNLENYDLKTLASTLESLGFEGFIMGPRYLPITHGSWDDSFLEWTKSKESGHCNLEKYPKFAQLWPEVFAGGKCPDTEEKPDTLTFDVFAIRSSHPRASEIKVELGVCEESKDYNKDDPRYLAI